MPRQVAAALLLIPMFLFQDLLLPLFGHFVLGSVQFVYLFPSVQHTMDGGSFSPLR
jgi:hypothetical protein